jgi:hypothetical protein
MIYIAALACAGLFAMTIHLLSRFGKYTGRRAAQADGPGVWFGPACDRWFGFFLISAVAALTACAALCGAILLFARGAS